MRAHHLTTAQAGTLLGTISGIAGAAGIIAGGLLIHYFARKDPRWQVWIVGIATVLGTCASIGVYTTVNIQTATFLLWLFVPVAYLNIAPVLSLLQSLVLPRMRGLTCAFLLFGANVANLALAPQIIGILSDYFQNHSASPAQALQKALVLNTFTGFWAAYHFWAASRHMREDLHRAGTRTE
jgi:MFS family permease